MNVEDIEIAADENLGRPYKVLGPITARVTAATIFSQSRTMEDVNSKLREVAQQRGRGLANAIINVTYKRGISWGSWKTLTATGIAVVAESVERQCPYCAESIKREAKICRFCGRDVEPSVTTTLTSEAHEGWLREDWPETQT